jgi:putative pyruvate formate lyase activating enzyme
MNTPDILSFDTYTNCCLCPRMCRIDRSRTTGFCGCSHCLTAARAALHHWEEPCISGGGDSGGIPAADGGAPIPGGGIPSPGGSGAVFFSGCTLGCCFCQNHRISSGHFGRELTSKELAQVFLRLQDQGAYNINLVTPTQYLPHIISALDQVRSRLTIPVVYNCGGYERVETVKALKDYVDIWLPDFKYYDNRLAQRYSRAKDYFETAAAAVRQMIDQTGAPVYQSSHSGLLAKGVIIRHMVLPGHRSDSIALLEWMSTNLPRGRYMISLMSQYTPYVRNQEYPELNRRITSYEYDKVVDAAIRLGLTQGFMQEKSSAREEYTPPFDLEGL